MTILRPGMRFYLINEIKELADLDKQKKEWVNKDSKHCFWDNVTTGTDCLWDGSLDFDENPEEHIGETLRNDIELKAVLNLIQKLDVVLEKIGIKKPDSAYLNSPLWNDVVEAAKQAYNVLMKDENLDALLEAEEKRVVV
jgi:hypothetical protein